MSKKSIKSNLNSNIRHYVSPNDVHEDDTHILLILTGKWGADRGRKIRYIVHMMVIIATETITSVIEAIIITTNFSYIIEYLEY